MSILVKGTEILGCPGRYDVLIKANRITDIRPYAQVVETRASQVIDAEGLLMIPGLINSHTHSSENLLKALADRMPLETWLIKLFGTGSSYTLDEAYLSTMIGCVEMLQTGTTAVLDHLWMEPFTFDTLNASFEAYLDSGIRTVLAPHLEDCDLTIDYGENLGFRLRDTLLGSRVSSLFSVKESISLMDKLVQRWHDIDSGRVRCGVGLAGIQWCSKDLMEESLRFARANNTIVHMHALETKLQARVCEEMFGMSGIRYLETHNLLDSCVSLAHCVWLNDEDISILANTKAKVVHNPAANLKLGSGVAPIRKMLDAGVVVGLGTDGSCSSDNQVMFDAIKLASLIHNTQDPNPKSWISGREAVEMATLGGASVLGEEDHLGQVRPGSLADVVLLNLNSPHLIPLNDPYKNLAFCETGKSVNTVIINGKIVVKDGKLETIDVNWVFSAVKKAIERRKSVEPVPEEDINKAISEFERFWYNLVA